MPASLRLRSCSNVVFIIMVYFFGFGVFDFLRFACRICSSLPRNGHQW